MTKKGFLFILIFILLGLGFSNLAIAAVESYTYTCKSSHCTNYAKYSADVGNGIEVTLQCTNPSYPYIGDIDTGHSPQHCACFLTENLSSTVLNCVTVSDEPMTIWVNSVICHQEEPK